MRLLLMVIPCLMATAALASDVHRKIGEQSHSDAAIALNDQGSQFDISFEVEDKPLVLLDEGGRNPAWIFNYTVENRRGIEVVPASLQPGDILLDPLKTSAPKDKESVVLIKEGTVLTKEDLVYVTNNQFRIYYSQEGTVIPPNSFKVGDVLSLYEKKIDSHGQVIYVESGFRTANGEMIIENGTTLTDRHVAMLDRRTPLPVRIRHPVELQLDMYLRIDWPDQVPEDSNRYWVLRGDKKLHLLGYQVKEGDVPLANIYLPNGTIICNKDRALVLKGKVDSIEILDKNREAVMMTDNKKIIYSIDPISGSLSNARLEPGALALAANNDEKMVMPILVKNQAELDNYISDSFHSYARGLADKDKPLPFYIHFTHYPVPFMLDCVDGCDERFDAMPLLMSGEYKCSSTKQKIHFPPFVVQPDVNYPYHNRLFRAQPITCGYCAHVFMYNHAKAHAANIDDGADFPRQTLNMIHPTRLLVGRMGPATLAQDVSYFKNGQEITREKGTVVSEDLRVELKDRAVSPLFISEPKGETYNFAQCPLCFGWNSQPLSPYEINGTLGVDELRRGSAAFDLQARHINKLEFVVFGLTSKVEPSSGRELAHVATYRRYGDEHFQNVDGWRLTSREWKYLPKFKSESGMNQPIPITGSGSRKSDSKSDEFDL